METYAGSAAALRSAATKLNAAGDYDAVLIADTGRSAIASAPLLKLGGSSSARILGTELWKTESNLSREPALRGAWFATVSDTLFDQLRQRYRARYGVAPYRLASLGYDATLLAVRIGREWRLGSRFPADALRNPEGFMGIDGTFRFDRDGVADRMLEVQEVSANGTTVVSPAPQSFAR
jgi:branched-chain amino acid transport system substrate-binding protein